MCLAYSTYNDSHSYPQPRKKPEAKLLLMVGG